MLNSNPAMRGMLSNPDLMRSLLNPANIQAMQQIAQATQQLQGNLGGSLGPLAGAPGERGTGGVCRSLLRSSLPC